MDKEKKINCCQSLVCTYSDLLGVSKKDAFLAMACFGGGVAGMGEVGGAVTGIAYLTGLKYGERNLEFLKTEEKYSEEELHYISTIAEKMANEFKEKNGSMLCREIKGDESVEENKLRSCKGCILDAARIIEENLFAGEFEKYEGEEF
jgi:C_GCAxxG_C_C family probable redox protein